MNMTVWNPFREMENILERYIHATDRGLGSDNGSELNFAEWSPTVASQLDSFTGIRKIICCHQNYFKHRFSPQNIPL